MKIETKYHYEKIWQETSQQDLEQIIKDEVGDADIHATLEYIKSVIKNGKELGVGSCKFRKKK